MELILRNIFLSVAKNKFANKLARKYGLRFGAKRFVSGETITEAIKKIKELNASGRVVTLDHLGEFVFTEEEAKESAEMCLLTLDRIHESNVQSHLSVKLTSLGLDIDSDLVKRNMKDILLKAKQYGNFVRIDMEDYSHCQMTIDIYKELREEFDNVGLVIQAYLYRTEKDMDLLNRLGANLRLVKGAYKESSDVAFPNKKDVDENYKKIIQSHMLNNHYTAVASHDEHIINFTKELAANHQIDNSKFEFQMLYGICDELQQRLISEGYKVRVYVPYGKDWFGYFMRRLAERPANVWFILKNLFK